MNETQKRLVGAFFASEDSASRAIISHRHVNEMLANRAHLHLTGSLLDFRTRDFDFIIITDDESALYNLIQDSPKHNKKLAPIFYFGPKTEQEKIILLAQENEIEMEYFPISSDDPQDRLDDTVPINPLLLAISSLMID